MQLKRYQQATLDALDGFLTRAAARGPEAAFATVVAEQDDLARIEGRIAIGELVRRFPRLRANGPAEIMGLARFRGYTSLPVRVD